MEHFEPLLTYGLYTQLMECWASRQLLLGLVQGLPATNRSLLLRILGHLAAVALHTAQTAEKLSKLMAGNAVKKIYSDYFSTYMERHSVLSTRTERGFAPPLAERGFAAPLASPSTSALSMHARGGVGVDELKGKRVVLIDEMPVLRQVQQDRA